MEKTRTLKLVDINGAPVDVVLKTLISAWDDEQIRSVIWDFTQYDEATKKMVVDYTKASRFATEKITKMLSVLVLKFGETDTPTPEFVKQNLNRQEFEILQKELKSIAEPENKKKESLPSDSSLPSVDVTPKTTTATPTPPSSPTSSQ